MGRRGYSPSPPRGGYERRRRSPSPRSRYSGAGSHGRPVERDLPTSLLVRNLRLDCSITYQSDISLALNSEYREPRGFGFVQYVEPADAAEAKYQMDGQVLHGREMTVVFAEDNRKKPSDMKIRERRSGSRYNERSSRRSPPRRYTPPPPRRPRSPPPRRSRSPSHSRYYSPPPPKRRHHSRSRSPISPRGGKRYSKERSPISPRGGKRSYLPSPARKRSPPHNGASRSPSPVRDRILRSQSDFTISILQKRNDPRCIVWLGQKWCSWIRGSLMSSMASILVNGSPTSEFQFYRGLKEGDPLAPYLFILVMESLHLSFSRVIEAGIFTGIKIDSVTTLSHLFYADDAIFIGEWSQENLNGIMNMLCCFSLMSGLSINLKKSQLLGVGVPNSSVQDATISIGCSVLSTPFKFLGVLVGGNMSLIKSWDDTVNKLKMRLSNWKLKTLSIGGRLTLLKSEFFNGIREVGRKITWVKWTKVLASKTYGGLGVSSFDALNRGLLVKWLWRFLSRENSLWARVIQAIHGSDRQELSASHNSAWSSIIRELNVLKSQGIDFISHCKIKVGNGRSTSFWNDLWLGDSCLRYMFPRVYALDNVKECTVADKLHAPFASSLRRDVRGDSCLRYMFLRVYALDNDKECTVADKLHAPFSSFLHRDVRDRRFWDLNGEGNFRVKDARILIDDVFLLKSDVPTRWVKSIPIKVNIFAWKVLLDRLPTRVNLVHRGVLVSPITCPVCSVALEDVAHVLFRCDMAVDISWRVCK
nr:RNA-directed DNA polymerase, eukaryota, reverse transcriptase zinc-binding domain protein [Tanacetum cinerariifolium]